MPEDRRARALPVGDPGRVVSSGVVYLAERFDVPVMPVTLVIHDRHLLWIRLKKPLIQVTVQIGEPIMPARLHSGAGRNESAHRMAAVAREQMVASVRGVR